MREIRIELSESSANRMRAAQMGACFQCGNKCKGQRPSDWCAGAFGWSDVLGVLRGLLRWKS